MKYRIVQRGEEFQIQARFLWIWFDYTKLPSSSLEEARRVIYKWRAAENVRVWEE